MEYLAKGKRSKVYLLSKKQIIKFSSEWCIKNEVKWLKLLNKHKIGPNLICFDKSSLTEEYIKGERLVDFLEKAEKPQKYKVLKDALNQCFLLDKLNVNKFEMTNPYKHIIIRKSKPIFIDFERCKFSLKPKNLSQFVEYISRLNLLSINKAKIRSIVKAYKMSYSQENYNKIIKLLFGTS